MGTPDLEDMKQRMGMQLHSFLVLEAKPDHSDLNAHIHQVVGELLVCARKLEYVFLSLLPNSSIHLILVIKYSMVSS